VSALKLADTKGSAMPKTSSTRST